MINHARTLILNKEPTQRPPIGELGEEFVPPEYRELRTSGDVLAALSMLVGGDDPLFQNYRMAQIMSILHANKHTEEYLGNLDSRITYDPKQSGMMDFGFGEVVDKRNTSKMTLSVFGDSAANEAGKRSAFMWDIKTLPGENLEIIRVWDKHTKIEPLVFSAGMSEQLKLDSGVFIRLTVPAGEWADNAKWRLVSLARPQTDLTSVTQRMEAAGLASYDGVFTGVPPSFYNLWRAGLGAVDKLAGLLGAVVYRMDKVFSDER